MDAVQTVGNFVLEFWRAWIRRGPFSYYILVGSIVLFLLAFSCFVLVYLFAPLPRAGYASELRYSTVEDGTGEVRQGILTSWVDSSSHTKKNDQDAADTSSKRTESAGPAEVFMSVVVPAFNEEHRLRDMLDEAAQYLNASYASPNKTPSSGARQRKAAPKKSEARTGWEILVVSDGSTDDTRGVALEFAKSHGEGSIRVVELVSNRGKGGAVVWGMKHARGQYVVFADADGASKFSDLSKLVETCESIQDSKGRAVAVGSRAHLVGSAEVVKRSALRNLLMHGFHLLIWLATPSATSRIKDTQCGFKLFSRPSLPYIIPHMHSEGWIFDVEMLMLAERAGIPMKEVPVGWHEVKGSKLNVIRDSIGMAWTLLVLRAAWALGIYQTADDQLYEESLYEALLPNKNYLRYENPPKLLADFD